MIKFKRFNPDKLKTDMSGDYPAIEIIFVDSNGILRQGTLTSERMYKNECSFYVDTYDGCCYEIHIDDLYCEFEIEE